MTPSRFHAALHRGLTFGLPAGLLLAALLLRIAGSPLLESLQLQVFDQFQRAHPRPYQAVPVRIVDVDDATLARLGQWPWPRTLVARLVERLHALGASAIAFDIVFAEPDRTSPRQVLPLWPIAPAIDALRETAGQLPDHDQVLAQAIGEARVVTGFALTAEPNGAQPALKTGIAHAGDDPLLYAVALRGAVTTLPSLEQPALGNGHFNLLAERDGMIRRVPLLLRLGDTLYPSLVAEALRVAQGASAVSVKSSGASGEASFGQHTGMARVKIGRFTIPTDERGRAWVYYTVLAPERTIPAWTVLDGSVEPGALEGAIVFVGTSATGLKDLRATPLNPVAAGVEVHAQLTEQVLAGQFLERPDWAGGAELVYLLVLGAGLLVALPRLGALGAAVFGAGAIAAALAASWYAFTALHWLLDPVYPSLVVLAIYLVSSFLSYLRTEAERRQVRQAFSRYLSPALVDRLARHPEQLRLGGERRVMTVLFADIQDFTAMAEQLSAEELGRFMNRFLTPMTQAVLEQAGTVDKYIGDCIMAFWNAPLEDPDHPSHGCRTALAMRRHLVEFNRRLEVERAQEGRPFAPVHIGIGVNTGECSVGNFGSEQRFDYSVLGDSVNLASRLQGQSKSYGVDVVIGESTAQSLGGSCAALELDLIAVKGKTQPGRIFALLGDEALARDERLHVLVRVHDEMLAAYRAQDWDRAETLIRQCLELDTAQTRLSALYRLYSERIAAYRVHPPGTEWDGVFVATTK
ncbi:MAG: adenylate/guanylate cyclase domain-containing protein [Candidatus Omnitrophica bacterium]|nr:adenylate/guanylate cyclase domain-containing protein [Candidatus Omnitrophota bacterium]